MDVAFAHAENVDAISTIETMEETNGLFSRRIERRMFSLYSEEDDTRMNGTDDLTADSMEASGYGMRLKRDTESSSGRRE